MMLTRTAFVFSAPVSSNPSPPKQFCHHYNPQWIEAPEIGSVRHVASCGLCADVAHLETGGESTLEKLVVVK